MKRREFLASSALPLAPAPEPAIWRNRQSSMVYRRLGRTGYMVSAVVCGGNTITPDNCGHVELAIDMGLNYLDTAAAYGRGRSEQGFARIIAGSKRERVFLNTKVSAWTNNRIAFFRKIFDSLPESEQAKLRALARERLEQRRALEPDYFCDYFKGQRAQLEATALANVLESRFGDRIDRKKDYRDLIIESVDASLRRLGTDYLDLLTCPHGACTGEELTRFPEIFDAFEALKKAGKVRHLSVSAHSDPAGVLEAAVEAKVYSAAMVAYNIVNHRYVDAALQKAARAGLGVIAMKVARPVNPGREYGTPVNPAWLERLHKAVPGDWSVPQKAYLFALRNPHVAAVNSDLTSEQMVRENLAIVTRV